MISTLHPGLVAFASDGSNDPSVRTRLVAWAERTGTPIELHVGGTIRVPRRYSKDRATVVMRNASKTSLGRFEARALRSAPLGVYDLDDGLPWDTGRLPGMGHWWKVPFRRDRIALACARAADRVIAGNETLASWASEYCPDVRVIPTCVEPTDYVVKHDYELNTKPSLIWIGSAATEFELWRLAPALVAVHELTQCVLTIVGAPHIATPVQLQGFTRRVAWSPEAQRVELAAADVGLMPLSDGVYQRAKCGYKVLQYAAAALPSVASPIGVNTNLLALGLGRPATTEEEWVDQIMALLQSEQSRRDLGKAAHEACVAHFSYARWESAWLDAVTL